jgi:hypothetical protein
MINMIPANAIQPEPRSSSDEAMGHLPISFPARSLFDRAFVRRAP